MTVGVDDQQLERIYLFKNVDLESIRGLLEACSARHLSPEEVLLVPNCLNKTVYFIMIGQLRIHLHSLDSDSITILGPGESVGELSVIDNQVTSAHVVADSACSLLAMNEDILWSLIRASHAAACNLLFVLAKRLRQTDSIIVEGVQLEKEFQHYGNVDALTGLHNRYWFDSMFRRQHHRSVNSGRPLSLIMTDIDHFKVLNDTYGHLLGDQVLYEVAHLITENIRPYEMVARYGGDEFIVLLTDAGLDAARLVAERVRMATENAPSITRGRHTVPFPTLSIGVTEMQNGQSSEMLIHAADDALYRAKTKGRNCIAE